MPFLQTLEERESYRKTHAWKRIEQLSVDIISDLLIPEKFKFRIFHTVWSICMEINLVTRHYFKFLFCCPPLTNNDLRTNWNGLRMEQSICPSTQQYLLKFQLWVVVLAFAKFPRTSSLTEIPRKYGNTLNRNQFSRIAVLLFYRCIDEIDSFHHRGLFLSLLSECPQHFSIDNKNLKILFAYHLVRLMTYKFPFLLCGKTLQEKEKLFHKV
ncbi:hypothetical protein CEXT_489471 [Caerostris extrusa]|uniref:Uncharacterized protein n=1 Tax=Caerostris extrusa TaxID=172846 RepID=A0AAV4VCP8_CAEEX|nr:hypothetical protein CEXT_489471 [Caerostris extrusa]